MLVMSVRQSLRHRLLALHIYFLSKLIIQSKSGIQRAQSITGGRISMHYALGCAGDWRYRIRLTLPMLDKG